MNSLRTKIIAIVLVFLSLTGTAFVIYSARSTVNYKNLRRENIDFLIKFETEKVNRIIGEIQQGAVFYTVGGLLCYQDQSEELYKKMVVEYLNGLPSAVGGGFWYEPYALGRDKLRAGFYAFREKASGEVRFDNTFFMDEYDYHKKIWYREIKEYITKPYQVVWTRPYVDDSGSFSLMTTAGAGVFDDDGRLVAISTSDWEIEDVVKQLMTIHPTENSFVLLVDPKKDYVISGTGANVSTGDSLESITWDINADSFLLNKIKYITFRAYMDNGWLLSVQIPESEMFAEVNERNSRFSTIIALAYVAMFFLAYLSTSLFINRPIKQLTTEVAHIALGNLDRQINISSNDEIGQLAKTFNDMTVKLKESIEENVHDRVEKKRINTELGIATEIQTSMLPNTFPPFPERKEFDIYASMTPAREVGGDFYDFFFINKDNFVVVIADVSGKGIPAALFMVVAKTLIKNCSACRTPKDVFTSVNKKLCENNEACVFVTSFMAFYNIPTKKFTFVNAGHNPPLIKRRDGSFEYLRTEPCVVLGWMEDAKYREEEIILGDGDVLYLYTDGVTEAMDEEKSLFGEERLLNALNQNKDCAPKELLHAIKVEVDRFRGSAEQADDITMLAFKIGEPEQKELNKMKELQIEAKVENLDVLTAFIGAELEKCGCSQTLQNEIGIAVEEIFVNIANYAYTPEIGTVRVSVSAGENTTIKFEDTGRPYNPLDQADPNLETPIIDREIGGLGVFLVKKIMDKVEYIREGDKNILIMNKSIAPAIDEKQTCSP